jgi:hypothetical protein
MLVRKRSLLGTAMTGLSIAAVSSLSGCDDPQTGSLKLGVSASEIDKEVNKLGNPGQSSTSPQKAVSGRTPAPAYP